jgi:hypothetical protein
MHIIHQQKRLWTCLLKLKCNCNQLNCCDWTVRWVALEGKYCMIMGGGGGSVVRVGFRLSGKN